MVATRKLFLNCMIVHVTNLVSMAYLYTTAPDFKTVQKDVSDFIKDRILVGHAVHHDLKVHVCAVPLFSNRVLADYCSSLCVNVHGIKLCKQS